MQPGQALASFFLTMAEQLLKAPRTPKRDGAVAMFLECAQKSLGK